MYSSLSLIDEENNLLDEKWIRNNELKHKFLFYSFLRKCHLSPGMVIRRSVCEKCFPLNLVMCQYQDLKMHVDLMLENESYITSETLIRYRKPNVSSGISFWNTTISIREKLKEDKLMVFFENQ